MPFEVQVHTVPHWKALRYGKKCELRGLSCNISLNICQDVMKSANLLHKRGFGDSQSNTTVGLFACVEPDVPIFKGIY